MDSNDECACDTVNGRNSKKYIGFLMVNRRKVDSSEMSFCLNLSFSSGISSRQKVMVIISSSTVTYNGNITMTWSLEQSVNMGSVLKLKDGL
jgi:hypothetical protein